MQPESSKDPHFLWDCQSMVGANASAGTKMRTSRISRQDILFGFAFVVLNILDAYLTRSSSGSGGH
jgi:hypothetical protein